MTRLSHAITHLIPEVRPLPGQRSALFKNAPGVFSTHLIPEVRPLPGQRSALFKNAPGVFSTHLIPEVRPLPDQRSALFKNAPGVFVHGAGRFSSSDRVPCASDSFDAARGQTQSSKPSR